MPRANTAANKATAAKKKNCKKTDEIKEQQCELAPFANNPHQTEYTKMMHRYADLDKREKAVRRKQRFANWMLFASVVLVIGCMIATAFVCTTIQSIRL